MSHYFLHVKKTCLKLHAIMKQIFLLGVGLSLCYSALGQSYSSSPTLQDTKFIIQKERKHLLPEASRLFESAPTAPRATEPEEPLKYHLPVIPPTLDLLPRKTLVLRAKQDVLSQLYGNYAQGGYGNFYTPYLVGYFANKRHSQHAYGLHLRHLSSGQEGHAEEAHNLVQLHGKKYLETWWLGGDVFYSRDSYPLYHADHSTTVAASTWQQIGLRSTLANYTQGAFNYQVDMAFHHLREARQARENQWGLNGEGDYALDDTFTLKATTDLYLTQYSDTATVCRHLWRVQPLLTFPWKDFDVQGGVNMVYQNDQDKVVSAFNVYPVAEVAYTLHKWLRPYGGIRGDLQRNSLQSFVHENPWIASDIILRNTNQRFVLCGGIRGDVGEQVSFHTGVTGGKYQNLPCWVNSSQASGQFEVEYDPAATLINAFGELTHTHPDDTWTTRLRGDYFHYTLEKLPKPWHRPRYQLDLVSTYRLYDKVLLNGGLHWLGGLEALDIPSGTAVALKDVVEMSLGIDYWWSSRFSIFLHCENLLACRNERYLHYPARGFHGVLGLTYAW